MTFAVWKESVLTPSSFLVGGELVRGMEGGLRGEGREGGESVGGALIRERLGVRHLEEADRWEGKKEDRSELAPFLPLSALEKFISNNSDFTILIF